MLVLLQKCCRQIVHTPFCAVRATPLRRYGVAASNSHIFLLRCRAGLEQFVSKELEILLGPGVLPEGSTREGLIEIRAQWSTLAALTRCCRLVESVSVRVGDSFQCPDEHTLVEGVKAAPWHIYLPEDALGRLPVSAKTKSDCRLKNAERIENVVAKALSWLTRSEATLDRDAWSAYRLGLQAVIRDDKCSLELACSGPLGVRPFVYTHNFADGDEISQSRHRPVETPFRGTMLKRDGRPDMGRPAWSLLDASSSAMISVGQTTSEDFHSRFIQNEWHGTKDLASTYAAAIAQQLPLRELLASPDGLVVWDPFCGNGSLLLEIISLVLGLPIASTSHPYPYKLLLPEFQDENAQSERKCYLAPLENLGRLTLVGSDSSSIAALRARRFLYRFCEYYKNDIPSFECSPEAIADHNSDAPEASLLVGPMFLDDDDDDEADQFNKADEHAIPITRRALKEPIARQSDATGKSAIVEETKDDAAKVSKSRLRSFSSHDDSDFNIQLPCEVSLNVSSFEKIAPFISGALVVTKVPREVLAKGPTVRIARLYEKFGHYLASRKDWCGVYVFAEDPDFKRHSRLKWEVLARFKDHAGRKCRLLRMM